MHQLLIDKVTVCLTGLFWRLKESMHAWVRGERGPAKSQETSVTPLLLWSLRVVFLESLSFFFHCVYINLRVWVGFQERCHVGYLSGHSLILCLRWGACMLSELNRIHKICSSYINNVKSMFLNFSSPENRATMKCKLDTCLRSVGSIRVYQ